MAIGYNRYNQSRINLSLKSKQVFLQSKQVGR